MKDDSLSQQFHQDNEVRYRTLFERTSNPIFIIDSEGHYIDCNESAAQFLELPKKEILTKSIIDFAVQDATLEDRVAKHKKCWEEGGTLETHYLVGDQRKTLELTITPLLWDGRKLIFGIGNDITERRRVTKALAETQLIADNALRKSEERYRTIFHSSNDAIFIHDSSGGILDANPKASEMVGYTHQALLTMNYCSLFDEGQAKKCQSRLLELMTKGEMETETRFVKMDGTVIDVKIRCTILDREEAIIQSVVLNVTEQKRSESEKLAFQRLNQRLTGCLNMKDIGRAVAEETWKIFKYDAFSVFYIDRTKKIIYAVHNEDTPEGAVRPEEMEPAPPRSFRTVDKDYSVPVLINRTEAPNGANIMRFGVAERLSRSLMFAPVIWRDEAIARVTVQSYTPNRYTQRDFALLQALADQCGAAFARILVEEERKKLEAQVRHTQKLESLGILAGGIAHDFNNLLTGILGNAALALKEIDPTTTVWDSIFQVKKAAQKAAELARQMLAYSGKSKLITQTLNVPQLVEEMAHLLQVSVSKNATLKYDFHTDIPQIEGDGAQIQQVLMNLIINASEALGNASGTIVIRTGVQKCTSSYLADAYAGQDAPEGEYVYIEVIDNGCGMDKDVLSKIFDPFYTTKFTGRGLGLASVLGIVRSHHGILKVYSEVRKGTTFRLLFPACGLLKDQPVADPHVSPEWKGEGTVLLVDDDEIVLQVAERIIQSADLAVVKARNGKEALEQFQRHGERISAVLLDMTMPIMGGEETFRELRRIDPNVKVILSSGYSEQDATSRFTDLGLDGFAQKPYEPSDLLDKLKTLICG